MFTKGQAVIVTTIFSTARGKTGRVTSIPSPGSYNVLIAGEKNTRKFREGSLKAAPMSKDGAATPPLSCLVSPIGLVVLSGGKVYANGVQMGDLTGVTKVEMASDVVRASTPGGPLDWIASTWKRVLPAATVIEVSPDGKSGRVKGATGTCTYAQAVGDEPTPVDPMSYIDLKAGAWFTPAAGYPWVAGSVKGSGSWGRAKTSQAATPVPDPSPDPVPIPPPITPPITTGQIIGLNFDGGYGDQWYGYFKAHGIGYVRTRSGYESHIPAAKAAGVRCAVLTHGESGKIADIDVAQYTAQAISLIKQHNAMWFEVLNEPEGNWFWSDSGTPAAIAKAVELCKSVKQAIVAAGLDCKVAHSAQGYNGYRSKFKAAGGYQWVDGAIVHPYGGTTKNTASAAGDRQGCVDAYNETGKVLLLSEWGWPTAVGKPPTGESAQWTETEQVANIVDFCKWIRANPKMIASAILFSGFDYDPNNDYGVLRRDGSAKPSLAAFAPYADD